MSQFKDLLPLFACGKVIKGFGRGSKDLGIPTANIEDIVVSRLPASFPTGIYYGFGSVNNGDIHKVVTSIGWNPFFKNEKKSMESHLLHEFEQDFYGSFLKVVLIGFIRSEKNFSSLDELIKAIKNDIQTTDAELSKESSLLFKLDSFWKKKLMAEVYVLPNDGPLEHKL